MDLQIPFFFLYTTIKSVVDYSVGITKDILVFTIFTTLSQTLPLICQLFSYLLSKPNIV